MFHLKLLGGATIEEDGGVLTGAVARRHPLALLSILAASSASCVSRSKLVGLLWPDTPESRARRRLNACVHRVRKHLGDASVQSVGDDLQLDERVLSCDVLEFERALSEADHERAVGLYAGPFLDGFRLGDSAAFEHWVDRQRSRLRDGYREALEALAEAAERRGEHDVAATWWRKLTREDPYDSRSALRLMQALVSANNPAAALRVVEVHARLLEREFGTALPSELSDFVRRLRESPTRSGEDAVPERDGSPTPPPPSRRSTTSAPSSAVEARSSPRGSGRPPSGASRPLLAATVALLLAAGIGTLWYVMEDSPGATGSAAQERSLAVLPLDDLSAGGEHAYLARAMTEEITSALSEVPELVVTSRSSASRFPDSGKTVGEFARSLGVRYVVEGSVQRRGERTRIHVQLIDARTDEHLWTQTYERELTGLFDVQVEVARQVADRLAASFSERARQRILASATDDPVAYELYLRQTGAPHLSSEERHALLRGAVAHDSTFWPVWERLAFFYLQKEQRGEGARWADSSRRAFDRAIAHAPSSQVPRLEARRALIFGGDDERSFALLRAAAEERPSDLSLVTALGRMFTFRGRLPEAVRWLRHGALLDPLEASRWQALFPPYWWAGLYGPAERALQRALDIDPERSSVWYQFSLQRMIQGDFEGALAALDSAEARGRGVAGLERGFVHWWAGDVEEAAAIFSGFEPDSVRATPQYLPVPIAHALSEAGDSTRARRIVESFRRVLESQVVEPYDPEWRIFPRLQLAAFEGDVDRSVELLRTYMERGGRDYNWFIQSPLFSELRDEPAFRKELEGLRVKVGEMSREMERDLQRDRGPLALY